MKPLSKNKSLPPSIQELHQTYHDLNSSQIEELYSIPTPLQFMRYVARNIPFVVRGGAKNWTAVGKWNRNYLETVMAGKEVEVAVTTRGNADSPLTLQSGEKILIKPHTEPQAFEEFISHITTQEQSTDSQSRSEVRYAQTQNDNLRAEYSLLFKDVRSSIDWASEALQQEPEAINLWIGNSASVTALHRDPYENIYVVIKGMKKFALLSGVLWGNVGEEWMGTGRYERSGDGSLKVVVEDDGPEGKIPVATSDPDDCKMEGLIRVEVGEGDMLYLPALWYHKVSQSCDEEGLCVAVNYWHDMEYSGHFYPTMQFARNAGIEASGEQKPGDKTSNLAST